MTEEVFDADWLALREAADHRSRARALVGALRREGQGRGWSRMVDLGAGTGSNLRYLTARIPWAREWTLVDHDDALLRRAHPPYGGVSVRTRVGDLAHEGLDVVAVADVVTASALLDLVSMEWLGRLRDACAAAGAAGYFALTYDGAVRWNEPGSRIDARVLEAVNEHQRSDKGFGPALGPAAAHAALDLFRDAGYRVRCETSTWCLRGSRDAPLVEALVGGWVEAAVEARPSDEAELRGWAVEKIEAARRGVARVEVGHVDVLALPPDPAGAGRRGG